MLRSCTDNKSHGIFAHWTLGQFALPVCDISKAIGKYSNAYEFKLLRVKYLMKHHLFKQTMSDLICVPADKYMSKGWLALAHCLYELRYKKEALEALSRNTDQKEKKYYLS